jgi:Bacteriophage Mu, GemA protein
MITKSQVRLIHLAKDRLGLSYEEYREILALYGGARSSVELDPEGFFSVMEHFRELGFPTSGGDVFEHVEPEKKPGLIIEMVTPGQMALIRRLEKKLGWAEEPDRLERFIWKRLGMRRIRTKAEAIKVIEALKAMSARKKNKDKDAG